MPIDDPVAYTTPDDGFVSGATVPDDCNTKYPVAVDTDLQVSFVLLQVALEKTNELGLKAGAVAKVVASAEGAPVIK